jgi:hypothetical protein
VKSIAFDGHPYRQRGETPGDPKKKGLTKRQRKEQALLRAPGSAAEAAEAELRRNKRSSRIDYDVVNILSQVELCTFTSMHLCIYDVVNILSQVELLMRAGTLRA